MVTANICPAVDLDIQKRSLPFLVDDDMVHLIDSIPIRGSPTQFVDISVGEDGFTNYAPVAKTKFNKLLSVVVDGSAAVPTIASSLPLASFPTLAFSYQLSSCQ